MILFWFTLPKSLADKNFLSSIYRYLKNYNPFFVPRTESTTVTRFVLKYMRIHIHVRFYSTVTE